MQQLFDHTLATMLAALTIGYSESALGQTTNLQEVKGKNGSQKAPMSESVAVCSLARYLGLT